MKIIWDSKRNWTIVLLLMVIAVMLFAEHSARKDLPDPEPEPAVAFDLRDILARDTLRAITGNNSISYFLHKGRPMGYEYELLRSYADYLDVHLQIVVARDQEDFFRLLHEGAGDIVADNLTVTRDRQQDVAFTDHHNTVRQVLVQRLPDRWWTLTRDQLERQLIRNPIDLIGKPVYVIRNSSHDMRLRNLSNEIGGDIDIRYLPGALSSEELIQQVANGRIDYTVTDNHLALINAGMYKNLDVHTNISFPQRIAWAVRHNAPDLLQSINDWMAEMRRSGDYAVIYNKYFKATRSFTPRPEEDYLSASGGVISPWDDLIKQYASELGWDWRLLAAQIYKESRFDPSAQSWAGARGLMQIVPETAERFGDSTRMDDPAYNIYLGVRYLKWLKEFWSESISDSTQLTRFVLASYNVGEGHVLDARRLADKYGKDSNKWDNHVDSFLVRKAYPAYYRDEVVYNGYCRGSETYRYVKDILQIYHHYANLVPA